MPYTIDVIDDGIVLVDYLNPFDFVEDIRAAQREVAALADQANGTLYRIIDAHHIEITFSDLVFALNEKARDTPGSIRDPRIRTVIIGTHELVKLKAESLKQEQYGSLNMPFFESLEEARAYIRQLMQEEDTRT